VTDEQDEGQSEVRIHVDSLEYGRDGLRTRSPIPVMLLPRTRVVLVRPKLETAIEDGAIGFPRDSSFPLPATLSLFWRFATRSAAFAHRDPDTPIPTGQYFQVFGHAGPSGGEGHNKRLSDRRANVGSSLLTADVAVMRDIASEEGWGPAHRQAMLRTLACDPGPIDGKFGARSSDALRAFQERYNAGTYHRRSGSHASPGIVEVAGEWNSETEAALFEAFVIAHGAHVGVDRLHPSYPANGCSEYNLVSLDMRAANRRLSLVAHRELPPHHENAPCRAGDESACVIVAEEHAYRCLWFRYHVRELPPGKVRFFDPRWLWLGDDRYLLSVLTTADEADEIEFEVFDAPERLRGSHVRAGPWVEHPSSSVLRTKPRFGVAHVLWHAGADPFDVNGRPPLERFPVFRARHAGSGAVCFGPWPESKAVRLLVGAAVRHDTAAQAYSFRLWSTDGAYDAAVSLGEATRTSPHKVVVQFEDVPLDALVCLSWGAGGGQAVELISDMRVSDLRDNCAEGPVCTDVSPEEPPPAPPPPSSDEERHLDAINDLLDGVEDLFDAPEA
jgi:hypothetical protein